MTFKIISFPFAFSAPLRLINQGLKKLNRKDAKFAKMNPKSGEL